MQKRIYCPFSYDPKEAQTQILAILLQIRNTLSTSVELEKKKKIGPTYVSPLLIIQRYEAQVFFFSVTLSV